MKVLSEKAIQNVEAALVLIVVVLGVALIPTEELLPICGGVILAALSAFFGSRLYQRRLDQAAELLSRGRKNSGAIGDGVTLSAAEHLLFGISTSHGADGQIIGIRRAQRILLRLEVLIAIAGVCAILILGIGLSN